MKNLILILSSLLCLCVISCSSDDQSSQEIESNSIFNFGEIGDYWTYERENLEYDTGVSSFDTITYTVTQKVLDTLFIQYGTQSNILKWVKTDYELFVKKQNNDLQLIFDSRIDSDVFIGDHWSSYFSTDGVPVIVNTILGDFECQRSRVSFGDPYCAVTYLINPNYGVIKRRSGCEYEAIFETLIGTNTL